MLYTSRKMTEHRTIHLRVEFNSYEKSFLIQHLKAYLQRIKRYKPPVNLITPSMSTHHEMIQFDVTPELVIPAFQLFQLHIELIHSFSPVSEVYFSAYLDNNSDLFPECYQLLHSLQPDDSHNTLLPLSTSNGRFAIPSIYPQHQTKPLVLYSLSLNITIEQMQNSTSPYRIWKPVESNQGNIFFPDQQSLLHSLPSIQHPPPNFPTQDKKLSGKEPLKWNNRVHPKPQSNSSNKEDYSQVKPFEFNQNQLFGNASKGTLQNQQTHNYQEKSENNRLN